MGTHEHRPGIAIIGVSCRFPQANHPEAFWRLLAAGQTVFRPMPEVRKKDHSLDRLGVIRGGFLDNPYLFDHQRFQISAEEAMVMDPQQRLMLELALEAIEDAGYTEWTNQLVGVFVGADQMAYQEMITSRWYRQKAIDQLMESAAFQRIPASMRRDLEEELVALRTLDPLQPHTLVGNLSNMIPGRIAHEFNLKGPAFSVDTACSSSLVAVHLACESLYRHESDLALAGGVNLNLTPSVFQYMHAAGVISPTGKCIPFSKASDGILLGEGAGMIALKRLDDAIRDQDPIWAVIRGSGINNDGRSLGLMAPAWKGQLALMESTYTRAGFNPARISAIESHGTSTRIGDGVELSVIEKFFPLSPEQPISVGSVKSNIGHTLGTAGIAGLIKMVLAIRHRQLPPSLHEEIDPAKKLEEKGIRVQNRLQEWTSDGPRCAGVSSFGFGGTNAHVILEEPEQVPAARPAPKTTFVRQTFQYNFLPQHLAHGHTLKTIQWQETGPFTAEKSYDPASWLLIGFDEAALRPLRAVLDQNGSKCYCVYDNGSTKEAAFTRTGAHDFRMDIGNADHFRWLLDNFPNQEAIGVLFHSKGMDSAPAHLIGHTLSGFRFLLQAVKQRGNARIWATTFGAYPVDTSETAQPVQRALAALVGAALEENPDLRGGLLDLHPEEPNATAILGQALGAIAPAPWVVRGGSLYTPSLQPAGSPSQPALAIQPGGVYLVLGGSSGIGALLAADLVGQGARKVLVSGTRAAEQLPDPLLALLPDRVEYLRGSATDQNVLAGMLDKAYAEHGQLDGILYAAGRIAPGSLANKKQEDFEDVLLSKIAGAHALAACLKDRPAGFVYLMSSISGLSPNWAGGMAEYAAANAFLDAFAGQQTSDNTPWMACSWGLWEDTGMAKKMGDAVTGFSPEAGLETFRATLASGLPHVVAMPAGQQDTFSSDFSSKKTEALPDKAPPQSKPVAPPAPVQAPPAPEKAPDGQRPEAGLEYAGLLKGFIAEAVSMPVEKIDETASFYHLGLDSLSAVDVAQKIEARTGMTLHPTILFEHDTIVALAHYLERHSNGVQEVPEPVSAPPAPTEMFPLIGAQKTFYAQQQFFPEKPCNVLVHVRTEKRFEPERLQAAWKRLSQKHDALRLVFEMTDQGPVQYALPEMDAPLSFRECADYEAVLALEDELVNQVFQLDKPPFYRLVHVAWGQRETALMLMMHHLIFDAWSMYVLLKELIQEYDRMAAGASAEALQPGHAFESYVKYHNDQLIRKDFSSVKQYWTQTLDHAVWGLPLPYREPTGLPSRYCMAAGELDAAATRRRLQQNQDQRLSVFHTMLAAFFLTLHRHTGREDMIIRVANANREAAYPEIESLAGCLADALPLRVQIQKGDDLMAVAQKVKQQVMEALRHTGLSSQDIAELPIGRQDDGPVILSPVGLSFVPMHHLSKDADVHFNDVRCRTALPFTDISLICFLENEVLKCCWNYDESQFKPESIALLRDTFLDILRGAEAPEHPVPPLELPAVQLYPDQPLLHEKVWAACARYNQRPAVVTDAQVLRYADLEFQGKQLANTLIGHLPDDAETVGIFAHPGIAAVVGLTGILASGRAFIPLDPDWPAGRIETILAHSGVRTVVTTATLLPALTGFTAPGIRLDTIVLLDEQGVAETAPGHLTILYSREASGTELLPLPFDMTARRLAYVMYTSGTSGHPKGVMVSHQAVETFLNWVSETFGITESDRFIHTSSLGFGGSIRQVFSTLLAGATLYPIARAELKDPQALYQFLKKHQITLLNTVPAVVNNLLEWVEVSGTAGKLPHLRYLLLGGEALFAETVVKWRRYFGDANTLVNLYGSTETLVNATLFVISPDTAMDRGVVPIGYQKKGSLVRLLNAQGALCAPGEPGELFVGGPCLAKGYYREPGLTAQKFVRLNLPEANGVFYSTGDIAQMDASGMLHFQGRNDDQIQLHGNRVELTEIEDAIYQTHQVKHTAVVDHRDGAQHWLAAFVELTQTGIKPSALQIRDFIAERLPAYMVPHKVILLDKMPMNQAGKTDRVALRRLLADALTDPDAPETVRTTEMSPTEKTIAGIWQKLLRISEVNRDDDFFRLGGDSILALEMLHQLRKQFQVLPKAVTLFRDRQLHALAAAIDRLNASDQAPEPAAIPSMVYTDKHPLSPSQKGFVLLHKLIPTSSPNWAGILQFEGNFNAGRIREAFAFLLIRHPMLRTVFLSEGAQSWQQVMEVTSPPVAVFDLSGQTKAEQDGVAQAAFVRLQNTDFDLGRYPLFQVELYQTGIQSGILVLCMHHIITDGWSTHIMTNDLLRVYDQLMEGKTPDLGPPPPLYTEAVPLLSGALPNDESPSQTAHLAYWEKILTDMPAFTPPSDVDKEKRSVISFVLPAAVKEQLVNYSKASGVTLYSMLLTLNARALMRLYEIDDLLINTAVSGRDLPLDNIQQVVGCFARNLPLRIALSSGTPMASDVKTVENVFFEAMEHQDVPPTALFRIATRIGHSTSIFSVNRFYFSFMDFSALEKYSGRHLSLLWDASTFSFSAGGAGSEIMLGVDVSDKIRINLNGYASPAMKERLKTLLLDEIATLAAPAQTLDTALIAYLPGGSWLQAMLPQGASQNGSGGWTSILPGGDQPRLLEHVVTPLGVSGVVFMPHNADGLRLLAPEERTQAVLDAIRVAHAHGARHVSMAGILPALTNYGYAVDKAMRAAGGIFSDIQLTTGHASTVVAVVKTIQKALFATGSGLDRLTVAVLGFGSIGQTSLSLLLDVLGQPAGLVIVDLETQLPQLIQPLAELKTRFSGKLAISMVQDGQMPDALYEADLIIGASSAGQLLDVGRFRPGTLLIDDSFPPVIDVRAGIARMQQEADVLLLGGGKLSVCEEQHHHLAPDVPEKIVLPLIRQLGDEGMPGCRVEPLILRNTPGLPAILGLAEAATALQYWEKIDALGIEAVALHLAGFVVPDKLIENVGAIMRAKSKDLYHGQTGR